MGDTYVPPDTQNLAGGLPTGSLSSRQTCFEANRQSDTFTSLEGAARSCRTRKSKPSGSAMAYESAISRGELPMDIEIEWQNPVQLTKFKKVIVHENHLPETIEDRAGVYFFSRKFGRHYIPFYIGETGKIRARLKGHLNWAKLVDVLRGMRVGDKKIKQGDRYFHYGYLITKKKQKQEEVHSTRAKISCQGGRGAKYSTP